MELGIVDFKKRASSEILVDRPSPKNPSTWECLVEYRLGELEYTRRTLKTRNGTMRFNRYRVRGRGVSKREFLSNFNTSLT